MINQEEFIKERMISEIQHLSSLGFERITIGLISQYIETLGAFLDRKPFKTPRQSAQRFHIALEKLFIPKYSQLNKNNFLYKQLRSNFTHLGVESQFINFDFSKNELKNHLTYSNKKTTIVLSTFLDDYIGACNKVLSLLNDNTLKTKMLA